MKTPYLQPYGPAADLFHRAATFGSRVVSSIRGQAEAAARWIAWARERPRSTTTLWMHAPSVGEALAAQPILRRLRSILGNDLTIVHTHTSPSVQTWPHHWLADRTDYLPLLNDVEEVCRAIRPTLMVYPRGELWPHLVRAGTAVGARQVIIAGRIRNGSLRTRWPTRTVIATLAKRIALATVCSHRDAERWHRLGLPHESIEVTGDPRDDYVLERQTTIATIAPFVAWRQGRRVMVAGSTHPADEQCLLSALSTQPGSVALVLVPHETNTKRTDALLRAAELRGVDANVWRGDDSVPDSRVLIVARQGTLQDLYAIADMAYVGGGFGSAGVHSVAEAAVYGLPILVGPRGNETADCERFIKASAATIVHDAQRLASVWHDWGQRPEHRIRLGLAARRVLQTGASSKTTRSLVELLAG